MRDNRAIRFAPHTSELRFIGRRTRKGPLYRCVDFCAAPGWCRRPRWGRRRLLLWWSFRGYVFSARFKHLLGGIRVTCCLELIRYEGLLVQARFIMPYNLLH